MQETLGKLFKNRSGAVIAGVIVAVIAVILLLLYLRSYRSSVNSGKQPVRVLVATKNIPAGTSGTLIAQQGLYTVTTIQKDQLQLNAITDPSALSGRVAAASIFPGQQLTQAGFFDRGAAVAELPADGPAARDRDQCERQPRARGSGHCRRHGRRLRRDERPGGTTRGGKALPSAQLVKLLQPDVYVLVAPGAESQGAGDSPYQHSGRREVRVRVRQRDRVAGAPAGCRQPHVRRLQRLPWQLCLPEPGSRTQPMADAIKTFVVLDAGVNQAEVERALPRSGEVEIVGDGQRRRRRLGQASRDHERSPAHGVLGQSDPILNLIDNAVTERPRRPVVVLAYGSPNGFTRQVFAAGADDVVMLPVTSDEVLFALQKALARKAGSGEIGSLSRAPLICVLGPKGGTGKTLTSTSLSVALAEYGKVGGARRSRPPVR